MEKFIPNWPTTIYIQHHTKTLYSIYPLSTISALFFFTNSSSAGLKVSFFVFLLLLPVCFCSSLLRTKLLDTMFDSRVFIDGVNAKRKLEVRDVTKISWFFYSHVWHLSFVGWILCAIECYFCITLFAFSPLKEPYWKRSQDLELGGWLCC